MHLSNYFSIGYRFKEESAFICEGLENLSTTPKINLFISIQFVI